MRKGLIVTGIWYLVSISTLTGAVGTDRKLTGDDSNEAVHLIWLHDEKGLIITADDDLPLPFSMRQTCGGTCHDYDKISKGWHFNAADANVAPGRPGEPWFLVDTATATQVPISYRPWPGTFRPEQFGITTWQFTNLFAGYMPGGGPGETDSNDHDEMMRRLVSGKLEINCLTCHNAHSGEDQAEYASQIARQNFRWAATAACEFASVKGSAAAQPNTYDHLTSDAVAVTYRRNTFDSLARVLFDIAEKPPDKRCYSCHYNINIDKNNAEKTTEDVHLSAGLTCVDCHHNSLDHNITRGYNSRVPAPANRLTAGSSCESCHSTEDSSSPPTAEQLIGAVPKHPGIPPVHFDKLTCTACHSGPWPRPKTHRTKTSRAHSLDARSLNNFEDTLPHILYPVFARQKGSGKLAPHKLIWPAFWATLDAGDVTPIPLNIVKSVAAGAIGKRNLQPLDNWPDLTNEDIRKVLELFSLNDSIEGEPVYICGGKLYRIDKGRLIACEHSTAEPYLWPFAHDVRPVAQSLGARGCEDCHSVDMPFFFGSVAVDSPVVGERDFAKKMVEFQDVDPFYTKVFALSFMFQPWLKVITLASCAVLAAVLLLYGLKALFCIAKIPAGKDL